MIDLHLINTALAALGIGAGVVLLIAAALIAVVAIGQHRSALRRGHLAVTPATPAMGHTPAQAPREPALR